MDISTLVVVFLLLTAATLASYALSHWSWVRGTLGAGWAATSIGTTMLLVAAAIVVLTFVFKGPLWQRNLAMEQRLREAAAASAVASKEILPHETTASASTLPTTTQAPVRTAPEPSNTFAAGGSKEQPQHSSAAARVADRIAMERSSQSLPAFDSADPWAATHCVLVYHPFSDDTEWKIENQCDPPVGLVIYGCDDAQKCGPKIVPSKLQRPVPLEEQIVHGGNVRVVACFASTPLVIYLMGAPSEERATDTWHELFETARGNDGCLLTIQN